MANALTGDDPRGKTMAGRFVLLSIGVSRPFSGSLSGLDCILTFAMSDWAASDGRPVRVLVVDDYAPMADHLAEVICAREYAAKAVYSGEEALDAAEKFSPQALIADVMMPGMNGVELVLAFAEKFPGCRAVLMTANQWLPEVFIGGLRVKVFQKPFEPEEIFEFLAGCKARAA